MFNLHAPHSGRPRAERAEFFDQVIKEYRTWKKEFPNYDAIFAGDFNGRVCWRDCFPDADGNDETNECGEDILQSCALLDLRPVQNQSFANMWTFRQAQSKSRIDYVLASSGLWETMGQLHVREPHDFATDVNPNSYHRPLQVQFNVVNKPARCQRAQRLPRRLHGPQVAQADHRLQREVGSLDQQLALQSVDAIAEQLTLSVQEAVQEGVRSCHVPRRPKHEWMDGVAWDACEAVRWQLRRVQLLERSNNHIQDIEDSKQHLRHLVQVRRRVVREAKKQYVQKLTLQALQAGAQGNHRLLWQVIRRARPQRVKRTPRLANVNGKLETNPDKVATMWAQFLGELFEGQVHDSFDWHRRLGPIPEETVEDLAEGQTSSSRSAWPMDAVPSTTEVLKDIQKLQAGKASGDDGLTPDLLQQLAVPMSQALQSIIEIAHQTGKWPHAWKGGVAIMLPKPKGGLRACDQRCIVLESVMGKICQKYFLRSLISICGPRLVDFQYFLGPQAGTSVPIARLRAWAADVKARKVSWCCLFFDVHKAFDSIIKENLHSTLSQLTPDHPWLADCLRAWQDEDWVRAGADTSQWFVNMRRGVKQGNVLAHFCFAVYVNEMARSLQAFLNQGLQDLDCFGFSQWYVDDLVVCLECKHASALVSAIGRVFDHVHAAFSQLGLELNMTAGKTEAIVQMQGKLAKRCRQSCWHQDGGKWLYGIPVCADKFLRFVQNYRYLGVVVSQNGAQAPELRHRSRKASQAFHELRAGLIDKKNIPVHLRWRLLSAITRARLLYGAETWGTMTAPETSSVVNQDHRSLRWAVGARLHADRWDWSYERCLREVGGCHILAVIAKQRLHFWAQHAIVPEPVHLLGGSNWLNAVKHDLCWLHATSGKTEELGAPNENFDVWVEFVRSNSCWFNSLLKRWQPQEPFEAVFAPRQRRRQVGVACDLCNLVCGSAAGLAAHKRRSHNLRNPAFLHVHSTVCPFCGVDFHYRPRVLQHWVHGAKTCREAYAGSTINEHSAEIEAELMQHDKDVLNAAHAAGRHPYNWCGPMREP